MAVLVKRRGLEDKLLACLVQCFRDGWLRLTVGVAVVIFLGGVQHAFRQFQCVEISLGFKDSGHANDKRHRSQTCFPLAKTCLEQFVTNHSFIQL